VDGMRENGWRIDRSDIVIDSPHLRLRADTIALPSGATVGPYYVRESRGFSTVFALEERGRLVLVRQYKHGIGRSVLELPAGGIDPGETAEACAHRELAEETGYADAGLERVGSYAYDPTSSTSSFHLYFAPNARPTATQHFDETEQIEVVLAELDLVRRWLRDGTLDVGVHIASIYLVLDRLGLL